MENKRSIIIGIVSVVLLVILVVGIYVFIDTKPEEVKTLSDLEKFTEVYEELNNKDTGNGKEYLEIDINEDAEIIIKSVDDIIEVVKGDALIYFGFETCPWCRNMLPSLVNAAVSADVPLYYVDLNGVRNQFSLVDGELVETVIGHDAYYELLDLFGDKLADYVVTDDDKEYDTGMTRIYAPTTVVVKDGEIMGVHVGTLDSVEDPYVALTEDEALELEILFLNLISLMTDDTCDEESAC